MKRVPPAGPAAPVAFETDVLAGFVLARAAAGLADVTIRSDVSHLEQLRAWFGRAAVGHGARVTRGSPKLRSTRVRRVGVFVASQAAAWAGSGGEVAQSGEDPTAGACLTGCTTNDALVAWCGGLALVRAAAGVATGASGADGSGTARKYSNSRGRGGTRGTREDGDLQGWTRVDVLPPDGMQEVSGSSPLSSTGQKQNSNTSNNVVQQESTATAAEWAAVRVFGSGMFLGLGCWEDSGFQALNRRWSGCDLGKSPPCRSRDFCRLVITRSS